MPLAHLLISFLIALVPSPAFGPWCFWCSSSPAGALWYFWYVADGAIHDEGGSPEKNGCTRAEVNFTASNRTIRFRCAQLNLTLLAEAEIRCKAKEANCCAWKTWIQDHLHLQ